MLNTQLKLLLFNGVQSQGRLYSNLKLTPTYTSLPINFRIARNAPYYIIF